MAPMLVEGGVEVNENCEPDGERAQALGFGSSSEPTLLADPTHGERQNLQRVISRSWSEYAMLTLVSGGREARLRVDCY